MGFHRDLAGEDLHAPSNERVENNTGSGIAKMRAVKFNGFGSAFMQVQLADGSTDIVRGVTQELISNGQNGFMTALGVLSELDTSSFSVGDILYAGASGVLQTTPNGQEIAEVLVSDSTQGIIYVQVPPSGTVATVNPFGTEFDQAESNGVSTTTSTSFIEKLKLTTANLPLGNYLLTWGFEVSNTANDKPYEARVHQDDTTILGLVGGKYSLGAGLESHAAMSGFKYLTSFSGIHDFDIDFRSPTGEGASIRRARLTIWRVS